MSQRPPDNARLFSREAEAAVLGSMILDPGCICRVLPMLPRADLFAFEEHRAIYEAILSLFTQSKPVDGVAVRTELKERGTVKVLDAAGGETYLQEVLNSVPSSANVSYYASIVREKERERQLRSAVAQVNEIIEQDGKAIDRLMQIQNVILELDTGRTDPDFVEVKSIATQIAGEMFNEEEGVIATGFRELDGLIQGVKPGEFVILAGRPSMGKSAMMLSMALNAAKAGVGVLILTLEMSVKSLVERALCSMAAVDVSKIRSGRAGQDICNAIYEQAFELQKYDVILSPVAQTPDQQRALIHRLKQTHDIGVVFIDYLQLMSAGQRAENRQQEITVISRKLKALAIQENVPIVALSQLNRQVDARDDHRPRMSDLRESGSLEQDSDLILFLYRDDYYHRDEPDFTPTGITEIIVSKNRRGPVGKARAVFVHDYCRFANLPEQFSTEAQYE